MIDVPLPEVKARSFGKALGRVSFVLQTGELRDLHATYNLCEFSQVKKQPKVLEHEEEVGETPVLTVQQLQELGINTARLVEVLAELERKLYPQLHEYDARTREKAR